MTERPPSQYIFGFLPSFASWALGAEDIADYLRAGRLGLSVDDLGRSCERMSRIDGNGDLRSIQWWMCRFAEMRGGHSRDDMACIQKRMCRIGFSLNQIESALALSEREAAQRLLQVGAGGTGAGQGVHVRGPP
ncbi:hypothetical protein [Microvirga arsenatis]|uniref:Uncharacterized protein n=1 Tax=Microvirga arsenatis TaxID=2692265 RepID=A0ABW9YYK4_9HYPH|nr:hypothetical protein [Microvirga arsenatis]NBJ13224.1 hypothetical protein [Microvirga arsenatis]NBJ25138.1 hypothetical protein [Microvirga arsenatis]